MSASYLEPVLPILRLRAITQISHNANNSIIAAVVYPISMDDILVLLAKEFLCLNPHRPLYEAG